MARDSDTEIAAIVHTWSLIVWALDLYFLSKWDRDLAISLYEYKLRNGECDKPRIKS